MKECIQVENIPVPIYIQSYKNSKSVKLIFKQDYIKITKPKWYSVSKVRKYVEQNSKQIYDKYLEYFQENNIGSLDNKNEVIKQILYKGELFDVVVNKMSKNKLYVDLKGPSFIVNIYEGIEADKFNYLINEGLRNKLIELSKEYILNKVYEIEKRTGIKYNNVKIKDCKTIWGSCSIKGNLNFNYRLIYMPEWVMESIVVHEFCHRKYLNHNKDFWNLVYSYYPKNLYDKSKKWLKQNMKYLMI